MSIGGNWELARAGHVEGKATARVPTHPLLFPRLYYERLPFFGVIVEAGAVRMAGGDPCGRLLSNIRSQNLPRQRLKCQMTPLALADC